LTICRVAAGQLSLRKGTYEKTIEDAQELIKKATKAGAQII
jgi:predicted amidohydrolase